MRKNIFLSFVICLVMVAAMACSKSEGPAKDSGGDNLTLTVWIAKTFNPDADSRLETRIKSFADVSDRVKEVKVEIFPASEGMVKWNAAVETGNVPDVSFMSIDVYSTYASAGALLELNDVLEGVTQSISPITEANRSNLLIDGKIYMLPMSTSISMFTYRTDLFDAAGIKTPPRDWDEWAAQCAILKSKVKEYPFGHPISNSDDSETQNLWIMRAFGGRYWDQEGNVAVNSPETINAVNYIAGLFNAGYIPPTAVEWDSAGNNKSYLGGESVAVMNTTTLYNSLFASDTVDPQIAKNTAIVPMLLGKHETWKTGGTIGLSIFKKAPYPDISKQVIEYALDSEWYTQYMSMNFPVNAPPYEKTLQDPLWSSGVGLELQKQANLENTNYGWPCTKIEVVRTDSQAQLDFAFSKTLQKVILGGQSPESAVKELEQYLIQLKSEQ
jgi:multiple sugar transport system substrate-binding protein